MKKLLLVFLALSALMLFASNAKAFTSIKADNKTGDVKIESDQIIDITAMFRFFPGKSRIRHEFQKNTFFPCKFFLLILRGLILAFG